MKTCPKCKKQYSDDSLNFCLEDGTPLTRYDAEAETIKIPEASSLDVVMELTEYLKELEATPGEETLVRFEDLRTLGGLNLSFKQIKENFGQAAGKAGFELRVL